MAAMVASAVSRWSSESGMMQDRYCVPMSLPCRLSCVGSWTVKNTSSRVSNEITDGSNCTSTTSA